MMYKLMASLLYKMTDFQGQLPVMTPLELALFEYQINFE